MDSARCCSVEGCNKLVKTANYCDPHYKRFWRHGSPTAGRIPPGTRLKWIDDHKDHSGNECLEWPFSTTRGYGSMIENGKTVYIHRMYCERRNGPAPSPKHQAAHSCGNRKCVNPDHIRWATRRENEADKELHGTRYRGDSSPASKLTSNDVAAIRSSTETQATLAARYGVEKSQISNIKTRKSWKHVP